MTHEVLVIGRGISGAAAAYELAALGSVARPEAETAPRHHATGALGGARRAQLRRRDGARDHRGRRGVPDGPARRGRRRPLLSPRGALTLAPPGSEGALDALLAAFGGAAPVGRLDVRESVAMAPLPGPERVGAFEPGVADIDVAGLHQGYLRAFRRRGGTVLTAHWVDAVEHGPEGWSVRAGPRALSARIVVDGAGAWADEVGERVSRPWA